MRATAPSPARTGPQAAAVLLLRPVVAPEPVEDDLVRCLLCGRWFRSVAAHLPAHGVDAARYRADLGLEAGHPLEGAGTRRLRAARLRRRLADEPALRDGAENGRDRARAGLLTRDAARAARGRPHPEQRRVKTLSALAAVDPDAVVAANRRRGREHRLRVAAEVARRAGRPDLATYVRERRDAGLSLAAIEREAGLPKDWLSRHLADVAPGVGTAGARRDGEAWADVVARYGSVGDWLRSRHVDAGLTVAALAAEAGVSRSAVEAALRRHGVDRTAHATARRAARRLDAEVAARFGFGTVADYVADRRAQGRSWAWVAAESGRPQSWLRRRAHPASSGEPA